MMTWLRSLLSWILWFILTLVLGMLVGLTGFISRSASWGVSRPWAKLLLLAAGIDVEVRGAENADPSRPSVYVANHQSYVDVLSLIARLPVKVTFIAKTTLLVLPGLNIAMWGQGHIFVPRKKPTKALRRLRSQGVARLKSGESILVFPAGERSWDAGVGDFKSGAIALALWAGVPITPVAVSGSRDVLPRGNWPLRPGKVIVSIGAPIETGAYTMKQREELTAIARGRVAELKSAADSELNGNRG